MIAMIWWWEMVWWVEKDETVCCEENPPSRTLGFRLPKSLPTPLEVGG